MPYVEALVARGVPRGGAVLLIVGAIVAALVTTVSLMVPPLVEEIASVRANLPHSARELEELAATFGLRIELQERAANIDWDGLLSGRAAVDAGQQLLTTTFSIITIIVLAAYLLSDRPRLARFIGQFIPEERKPDANQLFFSISRVVGGYLRGQLITSMAIGVFMFVLLRILGVANPLAFAVLAAFADVVPLIGAFIATVPPVAAALQESATKAVIVLVALILYQQFEDRFLVPRVYGRTLNLPPIIVLIAVLAGAELLGVTGVLLSLPLAAAARVGIDYVVENRTKLMRTDQPLAPDPPPETTRYIRIPRSRRQRRKAPVRNTPIN